MKTGFPIWIVGLALTVCPCFRSVAGVSDEPVFRMSVKPSAAGPGRHNLDVPISLDLEGRRGVSFDFQCTDTTAFTMMTCYVRSGRGWYCLGNFEPAQNGEWKKVEVPLAGFRTEGEAGALCAVDLVRIAASGGDGKSSEIAIRRIRPYGDYPSVLVLRADSVAKKAEGEAWPVKDLARKMEQSLLSCGFDAATQSDIGFSGQALAAAQIVVLPYNPDVPAELLSSLERFVSGGGKVMIAYTSKDAAKRLLGVEYSAAARYELGWMMNCRLPQGAEVLEKSSGIPWLVTVPHGAFLARAWRGDGDRGESCERLTQLMRRMSPKLANEAETNRQRRARQLAARRDWVRSRPSRSGETRAMWCHNPFGLKDRTWEESVKFLKTNGFNMLVPNLCLAFTAYYESKVLPVSPDVARRGDQLEDCLRACRKYGVSCHPWRVCWNCGSAASAQQVERLSAEGRFQVGRDGNPVGRWLCPTHPENRRLELEAVAELAGKGADGVHLDYIRYPGRDGCFCSRCRGLFERRIGRVVEDWPAGLDKDAALAEAWVKFRCDVISWLVRSASERVHADFPGVKVSAAVAGDAREAEKDRGQDWIRWCRNGWLDVVCPMDYTSSSLWFSSVIARQRCQAGNAVLLPGIGLSCWEEADMDAETVSRHVESVRANGLEGFIVFDFSSRAVKVLPELRQGILTKD